MKQIKVFGYEINFAKRNLEPVIKTDTIRLPNQPINVNSTNAAMQLSAVYRCTAILSGTIASLPIYLKKKKGEVFCIDTTDELHTLLTRKPNNRMTSYDMVKSMIVQVLNEGNAYILIEYMSGAIKSLTLIPPNCASYDKETNTYLISDYINHIHGVYDSSRVIHVKNNSLDGGYTGVSTITYASRIFSIAASADNQNLQTFQNGSKVKGLVTGKNASSGGLSALSKEQGSDVGLEIEDQFNGGRDVAFIPGEMEFKQLSINPVDAQLLETKKFSVLDICRFYGVHPDKAFAGQSTNYKASEMSNVSFLTDTLQPILRQIEAEFCAKLIPDLVASHYKIEFDRMALYQTDLVTQASFWKTLLEIGGITSNEIRKERGLEPKEGGDDLMISCNIAKVGKLEQPINDNNT